MKELLNKIRNRQKFSRDELRANLLEAVFYHRQLLNQGEDHPVHEYLRTREIGKTTIERFRLGYASPEKQGLFQYLVCDKCVPASTIEKMNLSRKTTAMDRFATDSRYRDFFAHRLIFPIFSRGSDVLGFGGRTLALDQPKYLFSPASENRNDLFGLHDTARYIHAADSAVIAEGFMETLALYELGVRNVVGVLNRSISREQLQLIKSLTNNMTVIVKDDAVGLTQAKLNLPVFEKAFVQTNALLIPSTLSTTQYFKSLGPTTAEHEIERAPKLSSIFTT